jgi:fimbrial isopeptide formation D2 family protein/uncharacterized repeat protein (TIGR01451 family)
MLVISTARHRIAPPLHVRRSDRFGLRVRRRAALVGVALVTAGFVPMVLASPAGAAPPVFSFSESAPATVLYGTPATVSLSATETNTVTGYNLSIEDVLPAGVSYVTGSTTPSTIGDPQILTNEPSSGKTTLIWSNVSDLQPSSSFALGFQLQGAIDTTLPTPTTILYPGDSYSDSATAYVESDPREVPQFDTSGDASNYTTTVGPVSGTTEISPFETTITDPLPEHELERGVHDQQKIWTLTVTDNSVHATALNAITAWLPAGLEFLGCGGVDNTTSPTTTDSSDPGPAPFLEYPGAPALGAGVTIPTSGSPTGAPSSAPCAPATAVSTEDTAVPPGLTSSSNESNPVYTTAQWVFGSGTGDLSATTLQPGQTYTIRYLAAVPLLENTMTFNGGAPSGADAEASNLDNNNGADTLTLSTGTGSDQTTAAQATGTYSGTFGSGANPASADGQDTVTIHDVAIQKTVSSPNFVEGSDVNFTLDYETSEYRYSQSAVITDILPNGMCPISATTDYDQDLGIGATDAANHADCAPQSGRDPSLAYSSVTENQGASPPAGSFTITWNLGTLATNLDGSLTYTAVDRTYYQQYSAAVFGPAAPTLTGDGVSNSVSVASDTYATCENDGSIDAECSSAGSTAIYPSGEPGGNAAPSSDEAAESNPSFAGQSAGQPTISKLIAVPVSDGHGGITCAGASYSSSTTLVFQKGDVACFQLSVDFPSGLYTRDPVVEDYLPPNSTYVGTGTDGATLGSANTVTIPSTVPSSPIAETNGDAGATSNPVVKSTSDGDLLTWYLGSTIPTSGTSSIYASPGQVFQYDIGTTITAAPSAGNTFDLTQNLMKFTSFNSSGLAVADRNDAPYTLDAPSVTLLKGVESDGPTTNAAGNTTVGGSFDSNVDGVQVSDGGNAVLRIDVSNWGLYSVYTPTIWDPLLSNQSCSDISDISNSGTCYGAGASAPTGINGDSANLTDPTIVWSGSNVASIAAATSTTAPGEVTLSYQYDIPLGAATGDIFNDKAGVVSYVAEPDTGSGNVTYYPQTNNIATSDGFTLPGSLVGNDTYAPTPPTGTVEEDPSNVYVHDPEISKAVTPGSATIGQVVKYTLTATSPSGGSLYGGAVSDPLGTRLTYDPTGPYGPATASCVGGAIGGGSDSPVVNEGVDGDGFNFSEAVNTITLDWPDLTDSATNAVCTITFDATVNDVNTNHRGQTIPNSAKFAYENESSGSGTGSPVTSNSVNVTVTEPDVALAKTDSDAGNPVPHQTSPGSTVAYTLTVSNQNLANVSSASDMVVTDCVQNGATYVAGSSTVTVPGQGALSGASAEPTSASCTSGTQLTWNINTLYGASVTLAKNASAVITYQTTLPSLPVGNDTYPNSATVTVSSLDSVASPGARTASSAQAESIAGYSATASDTVSVPGAMVTKIAAPTSSPVGVDSTFTATVSIPAALSFPDLTAVDVLPDGMTFDSFVSATCEDTVTESACGSDVGDTTEAPVHDASTGLTSIGWWIGNINPISGTRVVTLTYTAYPSETYHGGGAVNSGNTLANSVGAYWGESTAPATTNAPAPSSGPSFGFAHDSGTETASVTVLAPSLSIVKSTTVPNPTPGETIPFTVKVVNGSTNSSTAYLTTVTDPIPSLLAVTRLLISNGGGLSGTSSDGTGGTITWTLTDQTIAPGSSLSLAYDATIAPSDDFTTSTETSSITNTATVNTYYAVTGATATGSMLRYDAYTHQSGQASVNPVFPSLSVAKFTGSTGTSVNGTTNIGQATSWHLAVTDTTAASVQSLSVVDTLPPYWTYDSGSTSIVTESLGTVTSDPSIATNPSTHVEVLTWSNLGTLDDTHTVTAAYQATPGVGASGNTNHAYALAADATGSNGVGTGGSYTAYQSPAAAANDTIPQADLSITKTNSAVFVSGANGTYAITVMNNGPDATAEPVTVTDVLPTGESFVSASGTGWTCSNTSGTVSCSFGSSGTSAASGAVGGTISLVVNLASSVTPGPTAITNTASVSDNGTYDPNLSNNSSSDPTTVEGADLSITKSHSGSFTAGQSGTYSIVVTNNGPATSAGPITVTDTLPSGETLASTPTGTGWSCSNLASAVTCTHAASIADGVSTATISLPVDVASSATGTITNTATVAPGPTDDPNMSNNSSSDPVSIVTSADLNIEKTLTSPDSGLISGQDATYTIDVNNLGPSDAVAPQVQDVLPAGESFSSASGADWSCENASGTVTCTYTAAPTLAVGASASPITLVVTVNSDVVSSVTNTAIVCSGTIGTGSNSCVGSIDANGTADPVTANNTSSAPGSPSVSADLTIQKSHTGNFVSGANGTYSITVTNDGPADSVGTSGSPIVVSDTLPTGESYVSATGTGWTCSAASQIVSCDYPSRIVADNSAPVISLVVAVGSSPSLLGTVTNLAEVTPGVTADGNPANNSASDPTTIIGADLSITKSHSGSLVAGANATYALTVANAGPATSAGPITVIDTLPSGESFVSASGTDWTCSDGSGSSSATVTCTNPSSVAANATMAQISLVVTVGADQTGTITNTAKVVPGATADPVTSNNTATDTATVVTGADLSITKSHSGSFTLDQHGTYSLAVANKGPSSATGPITVTDTLPEGEMLVSAEGSGWTCAGATAGASSQPTVTCSLRGTLAPATAAPVISLVVDVGEAAYPSVTNTAKVSSPTKDPDMSNNVSSDTLSPTPVADLTIEKSLTSRLVRGTHALYSVVVTDMGPSPAIQVVVTDPMPSGLVPLSATGPGWHCGIATGTNEMECTRASLDVDEPSTITLTALVTAKAGARLVNTAWVKSATPSLSIGGSGAHASTPGTKVEAGPSSTPPSTKTPPLAFTGFDIIPISVGGLLLIFSGLATLEVVRRRRKLTSFRG